jgi:hypothetical protein
MGNKCSCDDKYNTIEYRKIKRKINTDYIYDDYYHYFPDRVECFIIENEE